MGFTFRFESIVKHRQRLIDEQGRAVALASQSVAQVQRRLKALDQKIVLHQHQHLSQAGAAVDVANLVSRTRWVVHLSHKREAAQLDLAQAHDTLAHCQKLLQEAWRNKEILEKLRVTQYEKWRAEQAKIERQDLDEIGQIRANRQRVARDTRKAALSAGRG